jgi:uncharacterized Zn finger protein (UPF0148 family)
MFENLSEKLRGLGENISQGAQNFSEINATKRKLNELERSMQKVYMDLGRVFYEQNKANTPAQYEGFFLQLDQMLDSYAQGKEYLKSIQKGWNCPNCGSKNPEDAIFCSNCGTRRPEAVAAFCPNCGSPLQAGSTFCGNCGFKIPLAASQSPEAADRAQFPDGQQSKNEASAQNESNEKSMAEFAAQVTKSVEEAANIKAGAEHSESATEYVVKQTADLETGMTHTGVMTEGAEENAAVHKADAPVAETTVETEESAADVDVAADGTADDELMFCPSCGHRLDPGSLFCDECGTKLY